MLMLCFASAARIEASNRFSLLERTDSIGDELNLDCESAFSGDSFQRPAAVRVGLLHSHGPCARAAGRTRPFTLLELALDISRRDQQRVKSLQFSAGACPSAGGGFASAQGPVASAQSLGNGNYILRVRLGTPGEYLILILDTGSVVSWAQCLPCSSNASCYSQQDPIFDPAQSSSYSHVACGEAACAQLNESHNEAGCSSPSSCSYGILYGDNSTTTGDLATDILTIGNFSLPNFTFGCGHDNKGLFKGADGLVGLGQASLSLPGQTLSTFGGLFSYCLPSILQANSSGFIEFGLQKSISSRLTPLLKNDAAPFFYFVWLQGITVGATKLSIPTLETPPPTNTIRGGTIVDSGTVITRISSSFYSLMRDAFRNATISVPTAEPPAPLTSLFDTCYNISSLTNLTVFPQLTFHFFNGLDFTLSVYNTLIPLDDVGTACFAFAESPFNFTIIGNYQQQTFLFTFDIVASTLGIELSTAC